MSDATIGCAPRIETERLVLRGFEEGDIASIGFYADPDVMRFIPRGAWDPAKLGEGFARLLERRRDEWQRVGYGMWAVELKRTGTVVGHVGVQNLEGGDEIEIYYLLDKPHWNQGLATEAAAAAFRFAREKGLRNIVAIALPDNIASQMVMRKIGLTHAGTAQHYGLECVKYVADRAENERA